MTWAYSIPVLELPQESTTDTRGDEWEVWTIVPTRDDNFICDQDCEDCPRPECLREYEVRE